MYICLDVTGLPKPKDFAPFSLYFKIYCLEALFKNIITMEIIWKL